MGAPTILTQTQGIYMELQDSACDNKHTGTTIKVSDRIRSERAFNLQKGDEGRRVGRLTSRGETANVFVHCWPRVRFNKYGCNNTDR
jgi:hypothetical protein